MKANKEFFVGIDSDGTAFDSMTVKHREAFIPVMIDVWKLERYSSEVFKICEEINLYSKTRGIDRFRGLALSFDKMKEQGIPVPDYGALNDFISSDRSLSNASLEEYCKENPAPFLRELLRWSCDADSLFKKQVEALMPFYPVSRILKKVAAVCDIAVISSASQDSLEKDWKKEQLDSCVTKIYSQEYGGKTQQLKLAAEGKYEKNRAIMFGDAVGDYEAAQAVGIRFYPIIPGSEEASWKLFEEKYADIFFAGDFDQTCENKLLDGFFEVLQVNRG